MDQSPRGRDIEKLTGDPGTIQRRGEQIDTLGAQMIQAADLLKKLADGATGQKGLAVDTLQGKVGESYEDLRKAGERYQPTGPALVRYAQALSETQPLIASAVSECESAWRAYETKAAAASELRPPLFPPAPADPPKPGVKTPQEKYADASGEADAARGAWEEEARTFDRYYDTWEEAFERATSEIGEATEGNISDSFWDNLDGAVAGALTVLKWAGLVITVLAIVVGGPVLAALALAAALATLVLTAYSFARGNSSGWALAFAVVGVIPFGKLSLLKDAKLGFLGEVVGKGSRGEAGVWSKAFGEAKYVKNAMGLSRTFNSDLSLAQRTGRALKDGFDAWTIPNGRSIADVSARLFTGKDVAYWKKDDLQPVDILGQIWSSQYSRVRTLNTWLR